MQVLDRVLAHVGSEEWWAAVTGRVKAGRLWQSLRAAPVRTLCRINSCACNTYTCRVTGHVMLGCLWQSFVNLNHRPGAALVRLHCLVRGCVW